MRGSWGRDLWLAAARYHGLLSVLTRQPAGAELLARLRRGLGHQRAVSVDLLAQKHYFGVTPDKIRSEFSDHCNPFDNVAVEGFKAICILMAVIFLVSFLHFAWTQLRG